MVMASSPMKVLANSLVFWVIRCIGITSASGLSKIMSHFKSLMSLTLRAESLIVSIRAVVVVLSLAVKFNALKICSLVARFAPLLSPVG